MSNYRTQIVFNHTEDFRELNNSVAPNSCRETKTQAVIISQRKQDKKPMTACA